MEESASRQKKRSDRKGNKTRQKNKRGDSKVESNDSPEIPDRGETSDIPCLPSGGERREGEDLGGKRQTVDVPWAPAWPPESPVTHHTYKGKQLKTNNDTN